MRKDLTRRRNGGDTLQVAAWIGELSTAELRWLYSRNPGVMEGFLTAVGLGEQTFRREPLSADTALRSRIAAEMLLAGIRPDIVHACMREPIPADVLEERYQTWARIRALKHRPSTRPSRRAARLAAPVKAMASRRSHD